MPRPNTAWAQLSQGARRRRINAVARRRRINAVLAAAGYNFGLLLRWLARLLRALARMLFGAPPAANRA
jgi:hypothetical protein